MSISFPTDALRRVCARVVAGYEASPFVSKLTLGGSIAAGRGDQWSDLDVTAFAEPQYQGLCWERRGSDLARCGDLLALADITDLAPDSTVGFFSSVLRVHVTYKVLAEREESEGGEEVLLFENLENAIPPHPASAADSLPASVSDPFALPRLAFWCSRLMVGVRRGDVAQTAEARLRMLEIALARVAAVRSRPFVGLRKLDTFLSKEELRRCESYLEGLDGHAMAGSSSVLVDCALATEGTADQGIERLLRKILAEAALGGGER